MRARDDSDPSSPGGPPAVRADASSAFAFLVAALLRRFFEQNGREPLAEERATAYARRLWQVVTETGLPRPLGEGETGAPAEMPGDRVAALAARVFDGVVPAADRRGRETPTRQLLKACLQPECRRCRESYREQGDGVCRRQQLDRALGRIRGSQ